MNNNDITEVSALICRDFGFNTQELAPQDSIHELNEELTAIIKYLLDKNFSKLLQAMYRIDIDENKLKAALSSDPPDQVAPNIAVLIIERALQKIDTRRKYKQ